MSYTHSIRVGGLLMGENPENDFRIKGNVDVPINKETVGKAWQGTKRIFITLSIAFNFISWGIMYLVNHKVDVRNTDIQTNVTETVAKDFAKYKAEMEAKQAQEFDAYKKATDAKLDAKIGDMTNALDFVKAYFQFELVIRRAREDRRRAQGMIDFVETTKTKLKQTGQSAPTTADGPYATPASLQPHSKGN